MQKSKSVGVQLKNNVQKKTTHASQGLLALLAQLLELKRYAVITMYLLYLLFLSSFALVSQALVSSCRSRSNWKKQRKQRLLLTAPSDSKEQTSRHEEILQMLLLIFVY